MCWLSWNLEALNYWNPQGLSRPVMGLLYILVYATVRWVLLCVCFCTVEIRKDCGIQLFLQKRNSCKNHTHSVIFWKTGSWQLWFSSDVLYSQSASPNDDSCIPRTIIMYTLSLPSLYSSVLSRLWEYSKCHCSSKENEDKVACKIFWFHHWQKHFWVKCAC